MTPFGHIVALFLLIRISYATLDTHTLEPAKRLPDSTKGEQDQDEISAEVEDENPFLRSLSDSRADDRISGAMDLQIQSENNYHKAKKASYDLSLQAQRKADEILKQAKDRAAQIEAKALQDKINQKHALELEWQARVEQEKYLKETQDKAQLETNQNHHSKEYYLKIHVSHVPKSAKGVDIYVPQTKNVREIYHRIVS